MPKVNRTIKKTVATSFEVAWSESPSFDWQLMANDQRSQRLFRRQRHTIVAKVLKIAFASGCSSEKKVVFVRWSCDIAKEQRSPIPVMKMHVKDMRIRRSHL